VQSEPVIVVMEGGCVNDVLGVQNFDIFDWDDFIDNPLAYWDDRGSSGSEYWGSIESLSPKLYREIEDRVATAQAEALQKENAKQLSDPFWMVDAR
jgi:hypothetical protein